MDMFLLIITAIGAVGVYIQIHTGTKIQRATFLKDLYTEISTDLDARAAFYAIEYDELVYGLDFHGSDMEPKLDRFLSLLDVICEMHSQNILRWEEMRFFEHYLNRTANNVQVKEYIDFLNNFGKRIEAASLPFPALQKQLPKYRCRGNNNYNSLLAARNTRSET